MSAMLNGSTRSRSGPTKFGLKTSVKSKKKTERRLQQQEMEALIFDKIGEKIKMTLIEKKN